MDQFASNRYFIHTPNAGYRLVCLSENGKLNPRRVINSYVSALGGIDQYKKAEIHRKQEAATHELTSYEWTFDIVPAFYTVQNYYLIPDGRGAWKATNPDVDQRRLTNLNASNSNVVNQLGFVRLSTGTESDCRVRLALIFLKILFLALWNLVPL